MDYLVIKEKDTVNHAGCWEAKLFSTVNVKSFSFGGSIPAAVYIVDESGKKKVSFSRLVRVNFVLDEVVSLDFVSPDGKQQLKVRL